MYRNSWTLLRIFRYHSPDLSHLRGPQLAVVLAALAADTLAAGVKATPALAMVAVNSLDRLVIGILKKPLSAELGWSDTH